MGKEDGGILPSGYTQLDYIENNSTAYIYPDMKTSPSHRYEFEIYSNTGNNNAIWGSGGTSGNQNMLWSVRFPSDGIKFHLPSDNYRLCDRDNQFHRFIVDFPNNFVQIDDNSPITITDMSSATNFYSEYLFTYSNRGAIGTNYRLLGGCRSYKVFDNDVPICDLIPSISPDNIVGMYDIVGNKFFGGNFVAHYLT